MRMSLADQKAYPKLTAYVKHELPTVVHVPSIVRVMKRVGQLNSTMLRKALSWGTNPDLSVQPLVDAFGKFTPGTHELRIDKPMVEEFEAGRGRRVARAGGVYLVGVTILHELVHWGDDQDRTHNPSEAGETFETLIYGGVID